MMTLANIKSTSSSFGHVARDDQRRVVPTPDFPLGGRHDLLSSQEVMEKIRGELQHLEADIRDHLFLRKLRQKKVDIPNLRAFAGHQYHIMNSDVRSVAMMMHRFREPSAQSFFGQILQGEMAALDNLWPLAHKLEMSEQELEHTPLTPESFAYATYMGWLSLYGSAAEIAAGFLMNFSAWGHNCGHMSQALKAHYGFTDQDTVFFDFFATLPSCESIALDIIQDGLDDDVAPWQIQRAAYLFQGYEKMFWDTMVKLGTV